MLAAPQEVRGNTRNCSACKCKRIKVHEKQASAKRLKWKVKEKDLMYVRRSDVGLGSGPHGYHRLLNVSQWLSVR